MIVSVEKEEKTHLRATNSCKVLLAGLQSQPLGRAGLAAKLLFSLHPLLLLLSVFHTGWFKDNFATLDAGTASMLSAVIAKQPF